MIPDSPPNPRAELEARVTALLLGELTPEEATLMRHVIAADPELGRLEKRLAQTLDLVRETAATPIGETPAQPVPLKLSPVKREQLLAHFKTVKSKEFDAPKRGKVSWPYWLAAAALIMFLVSICIPNLSRSSKRSFAGRFELGNTIQNFQSKSAPASATATTQAAADQSKTLDELRDRRLAENAPAPAAAPSPIVLPPTDKAQLAYDDSFSVNGKKAEGFNFESGGKHENKVPPPLVAPPATAASPAVPEGSGTVVAIVGTNSFSNAGEIDTKQKDATVFFRTQSNEDVALAEKEAGRRSSDMPAPVVGGAFSYEFGPGKTPALTAPLLQSLSPNGQRENLELGEIPVPAGSTAVANASAATHGAEQMLQRKSGYGGGGARLSADGGVDASFAPGTPAPSSEPLKPQVFKLNYANAADVAKALQGLGAQGGSSIGRSTPVAPAAPLAFVGQPMDRIASGTPSSDYAATNGVIDAPRTTPESGKLAKEDSESTGLAMGNRDKSIDLTDGALARPHLSAPTPQPEVLTSVNAFTTFSLNISDVSFKLAEASLQNGQMPEAASVRSEEFINAFDYRDPEPVAGAPIGFAWERAGDPFAHNRDFIRFAIRAAAQGRTAGRPLNLVLLLDKSGSMERADRVAIIAQALSVLAAELQPSDTLSVVVFARTAHLFVDGVSGSQAGGVAQALRAITPEGGTNLEEAMRLAYETALRHYLAGGENRVVLLTDGAANLGNVEPDSLKRSVENNRKQGIAFDCFGVGWDGYNDSLLETLSRAGNGRYGFINTPEEAATEFAGKLAGALRVAAADVKVQVEFNPSRVVAYRQIGYAKDQLKKEDFRNNNVKAAQLGAAESGNALYTVQINPTGDGPLGTVHVRYRVPGTDEYQEHEWTLPYTGRSEPLDQASPAMRLAATAAEFSEWLTANPYAGDVTPDRLLEYLRGVPQVYGADHRPQRLEWMIRQAKSISGK